jgi:hypothetical protein
MAIQKPTGISYFEKSKDKLGLLFSPEVATRAGFWLKRFENAKSQREQPSKFFDGMTYIQDYITNENNKNTYLTPKKNNSEIRINTGTSEKKLDTIKNELLAMAIDQEIQAFDENDLELEDVGNCMNDIVKRSRIQEDYEDIEDEATTELLSQRGVFIREKFEEKVTRDGKSKTGICKTEILSGLKVFPGNLSIPHYRWDDQPYIVTYDRISFTEAKMFYGHLPNFKYVIPNNTDRSEYLGGVFNYAFFDLDDGECEVITGEDLPNNEKYIMINGVPMYNEKKPLPYSGNMYFTRFFTNKSMSLSWLYGRPFTSMAKTMQAVSNEMIRMLMRKFYQSMEPPLAIPKSGKIYSRGIFDPGTITQGLRANDIESLIKHTGVNEAEFAMYKLIEQKVEEFIGTPDVAQGMQGSREMSATEVLTMQKQFLKQLGYTIAAKLRMNRDLVKIRITNILDNYLDPVGKMVGKDEKPFDIYRSFTSDNSVFENKRKGRKVIKFLDRDLTDDEREELYRIEEAEKAKGNNIRVVFMNVKKLREFPKFWQVVSSIQEKEGTALDKVTFQEQLNQTAGIMKITGKIPNADIIAETFERKWKAQDWFQTVAPQGQDTVGGEADQILKEIDALGGDQNSMGNQVSRGLRGAPAMAEREVVSEEIMNS